MNSGSDSSRGADAALQELLAKLQAARATCKAALPSPPAVRDFAHAVLGLLFPHWDLDGITSNYAGSTASAAVDSDPALAALAEKLAAILRPLAPRINAEPKILVRAFTQALPRIHELLELDAAAIYAGDPAAASIDEVILAYPGFFAIAIYRIAHELRRLAIPLLPRMLTEYSHQRTGIDIHPGAEIGRSFCIDHGTGVVIGETSLIKDNVKIYQGVTLGALSVEKHMANQKRHPTIEEHVVIYSNATILGGETVIGHHATIGGNVWVTSSVEPHSTVYHQSDTKVRAGKKT